MRFCIELVNIKWSTIGLPIQSNSKHTAIKVISISTIYSYLRLYIFACLPMAILSSGCMGRRYLKDNESILIEQQLTGAKKLNIEELEAQYTYRPNDRVLFIPWSPYVAFYESGKKRYDSLLYLERIKEIQLKYDKKIEDKEGKPKKQKRLKERKTKKENNQYKNLKEGNRLMRMGEPLAVYDSTKEKLTTEKIKSYLHSKGYFHAEVTHSIDEEFRLVTSTYHIDRKTPYIIDSVYYSIEDLKIREIVFNDRSQTVLAIGENYDQQKLATERDRIHNTLLDNGYFAFQRNFINYTVDTTTLGNRKIALGVIIENAKSGNHRSYRIDSINFITDADIKFRLDGRTTKEKQGIVFQYYDRRYIERILRWRTFINQDSLYSRSLTFETQRQLSNVDIFKFISVDYDTTGGHFIANIRTSPMKKYQTSTEAGLKVTQGLPGPFFNAALKNRNTFKGLEVMELGGQIGFEGLSGASETGSPYSSFDYGANLAITFPQFIAPLSNKTKSKYGRFNPKTRLSTGINFIYRPEYQRNSVNSAVLYSWFDYNKNVLHNFSLTEINFIKTDFTDESYKNFLDSLSNEGNNLIESFRSAFVSSIWYSETYNKNDYGNKKIPSAYLRYKIESGGNTEWLYREVAASKAVEVYQYAKVNIDYRGNVPFSTRQSLAYRINVGVAIPYGDNKTLPYEKFYFAGGSNSIRAWEPRRLGPGSYLPLDADGQYNNRYEQPGEILLETSIEHRHKLFGFLHGALFVDAGNVWTVHEEETRPGGQFLPGRFIKDIAVGAGYGIRFDLSFLLLRLDGAWKVIDPGVNSILGIVEDRKTYEIPKYPGYSRFNWNIGIGYPF